MTGWAQSLTLSVNERLLRGGKALIPDRGDWARLRTHLLAAATFLAAALAVFLTSPPGHADPAVDCYEQQFLPLINDYRIQNGRQPLALNSQLDAAGDWMSTDLGTKAYFSHTDSLGRDPGARARAFGYSGGVGENIAAGVSLGEAQAVFDAWRSSAGHNANMLGATYQVIGIGRASVPGSPYGLYWTVDFGEAANTTGAPSPDVTCGGSSATVFGDVDCDARVRSADALAVLRLVAHLEARATCNGTADVDCDSRVTSKDALDILAYVAGMQRPPAKGCSAIGSTV